MDKYGSLKQRGYQLMERIGAGGFGAVYRGYQKTVDREVAIKIILPQHANNPEFIRRFDSEAQLVARLEHPHIVPLYDFWRETGGNAYLIMRWLPGNVQTAINKGPYSAETAARLLDQLAAALTMAHEQGIVHRDIKPDNILLDKDGNAFLADFGLAKVLENTTSISESGKVYGSPHYLSPEQWHGQQVTPQTDIYSLGLLMYEALTTAKPYPDSSPAALMYKHLNEPLPLLQTRRPDLPRTLNQVIQHATAKHPIDRYPDVQAMAVDFRHALESAPPPTPPPVPLPVRSEAVLPSAAHADADAATEVIATGPLASAEQIGLWDNFKKFGQRGANFRARLIYLPLIVLVVGVVAWWLSIQPGPVLPVNIAANPLAYDWVNEQADIFNLQQVQANRRTVQIQVARQDGMDVWLGASGWNSKQHPAAWLAEAPFIVDYATARGLRFQTIPATLVSTLLVWGIYTDRTATLTTPIDWHSLQQAAQKSSWSAQGGSAAWGNVKAAFALPCKNTAGFGVLLSSAASYDKSANLTTSPLDDPTFRQWLKPVVDDVPNFASLGQEPAAVLASNGVAVADFALLPESEWLKFYPQIAAHQSIQFVYPSYRLDFAMTLVAWDGGEANADEREAVKQFAAALSGEQAQRRAAALGLRPAALTLDNTNAPPFIAAQVIVQKMLETVVEVWSEELLRRYAALHQVCV